MTRAPSPPIISDPLTILNARTKNLPGQCYKLAQSSYGLDVALGGSLDIDENRMCVTIPFADGKRRDGVGDLLEVGGIRTERHQLNPVVLYDHAKQVSLPVAKAEDPDTREYTVALDQVNQVATGKAFFYRGKGMQGVGREKEYDHAIFCQQLFDLICQRMVRGGSIGYQVIKALNLPSDYQTGTPSGLHLLSVLMLEFSAVVLPANGDTVRKAFPTVESYDSWVENVRRTLSVKRLCGKPLSRVLVKSLTPLIPEDTKVQVGYEGIKTLRAKYKSMKTMEKKSPRDLGRVDELVDHTGKESDRNKWVVIWYEGDVDQVLPNVYASVNEARVALQREVQGRQKSKAIEAVRADWSLNPSTTEIPWDKRRIWIREDGSERPVTFSELASMVGESETRRLVEMAIRSGSGTWHPSGRKWTSSGDRGYSSLKTIRAKHRRKMFEIEKQDPGDMVWGQDADYWYIVTPDGREGPFRTRQEAERAWEDVRDHYKSLGKAFPEGQARRKASNQEAYDSGFKNGMTDRKLGNQNSYAWQGVEKDPPGTYSYEYSRGYRDGWWNAYKTMPMSKSLTPEEEHQLKVAKDTLKMPDAMAAVMGGPTKEEARRIVIELEAKKRKSMSPSNSIKAIRVRYRNKLIKGYAEVQMKFDMAGVDLDKQNAFLKDMIDGGFGKPLQQGSLGPDDVLTKPMRNATWSMDIDPQKSLDDEGNDAVAGMIGKASAIARKHGVRYMGNVGGKSLGQKSLDKSIRPRGRKAWYVVDDNGYAVETYLQGPDAGKPSPHPDRASAERAAGRLSKIRGWETEVTDQLPPSKSIKGRKAIIDGEDTRTMKLDIMDEGGKTWVIRVRDGKKIAGPFDSSQLAMAEAIKLERGEKSTKGISSYLVMTAKLDTRYKQDKSLRHGRKAAGETVVERERLKDKRTGKLWSPWGMPYGEDLANYERVVDGFEIRRRDGSTFGRFSTKQEAEAEIERTIRKSIRPRNAKGVDTKSLLETYERQAAEIERLRSMLTKITVN